MTPPTVRLITALIIGCFGFPSFAQSQTTANQKVATGTVSGRVTLKGKGVHGISVALRNIETDQGRPALAGTTDAQGNYRISNVPPGQYQAAPTAPVFVINEITGSGGEEKLVILTEGENVDGIDFTLVKGGVITGKVLDADGKPIVEERVNTIAVDSNRSVSRFQMSGFHTDDRGVYRVFGLPAGRYRVSVGQDIRMGMLVRGRRAYKLTFHPDAAELSQAAMVEVVEGGETSGIDITVGRPLDGYAASGRIIDGATGQPLSNVRLAVAMSMEHGQSRYMPIRSLSSRRGEFRIEGLRPGGYKLLIAQDEENVIFADPVPFEVVDSDVDNLVVKTSKGASLSGVVILDSLLNDKALLAKLHQLRLNVFIQGPAGSSTWRSTSINSDGSFRLTGLMAGIANFNALSSPDRELAKNFVVLYTERDGVRMTQGVEVIAGEETTGLKVVAAHGTGIVRGDVIFVNGTPPQGSRLTVLLTRLGESGSLRSAEVDSRGRFAIAGVPGGAYWLQVQGYIPGARNQVARQQVNVVDAVVSDVTITLDLNPLPGSRP